MTAGPARPTRRPSTNLQRRHSPEFVAAWRSIYCGVYGWRRENGFAVVPSLLGRSVFSYLPGLGYTDLTPAEAEALAEEMGGGGASIQHPRAGSAEPG